MKKLFFFAMLAAGMTAACQKPTVEVVDSDEPVAIQFGMKAPTVSVTKTKAPVDDWATSNNIHVVGYNYHTNGLLWVESGTPKTSGTNDATIEFTTPLYYDVNYAYDFRAYYLGDRKSAGELALTVPFIITGEEDIMAGVTNRATDIKAGVAEHQMYSAYAARRGVQPSLTFSHMLTRLNVTVEYPTERAEADLQVTLNNLTVDSKTTGNLLLAGEIPSIEFTGNATPLSVVNNVVMIEPDLTAITFNFNLDASTPEASQPNQTITLNASTIENGDNTKFFAGKQYNVTIKVYDLEAISVSATLTEWGDGGDVEYDPDNEGWTPSGYTGN